LFDRECSIGGVDGLLPNRPVLKGRPPWAEVLLAGAVDDGGGSFDQPGDPVSSVSEVESEAEVRKVVGAWGVVVG
jgi:hypothetical protein